MTTLIVLAKECLPGKVKTRLHPPFSLEEAARIASASLADTLAVADSVDATRRILCFQGTRTPPGAHGFELLPQVSGGLDERIAAAFDASQGPTVLIGMDTPQITPALLAPVFETWPDDVDAWFGPARDGGFWALALAEPSGDLIRGVPMSQSDTGRHQRRRLTGAGLRVRDLPQLTDMDTVTDLDDIVGGIPGSSTATTVAAIREARAA
jgi:glycosyltransferase A (GT-A) superfamily protein (DUF2064 family)